MTLDDIKRLIEFLREQDITEFELDYEDVKLRLKSGAANVQTVPMMPAAASVAAAPPVAAPAAPPPAPQAVGAPAADADSGTAEEGTELAIVKSPIVGTFYR